MSAFDHPHDPLDDGRDTEAQPEAAPEVMCPEVMCLEGSVQQTLERTRNRLVFSGLVFLIGFSVIAFRLIDLGLVRQSAMPAITAAANAKTLATNRADILDRNGVVLATTLSTASLAANPRLIADPLEAAQRLNQVLPRLSVDRARATLAANRRFVWLERNLTPREHYDVNRLGIPGLQFRREAHRFYPQGDLTAHLVGFADIDNRGQSGIERSFNARLRDRNEPLALSIDLRVQHILTEELTTAMTRFRAIGAAGIILDARSGEMLAMASLPTFDPARAGAASEDSRFNRASLGVYEMGSVFKIFTTAMALDQGIVDIGDGYDTTDPIRVSRFTIRDYKPKNRWLSIPEIFIYSSNIGTVHMAMDAGTEAQRRFLADLGLLERSGLELAEIGRPQPPSPWREINTMTISYGHGLAVSPVQLASAVGAIVNGGLYRTPTLLRQDRQDERAARRVISRETSATMRQLMRLVVTHGTGRKANAQGFSVGGKTGTADKLDGHGRYRRDSRIASFVGAYPMQDPRYVIFIMVDEPKGIEETLNHATGGWVAAPVVRRVVERMAPIVAIEPLASEPEEDSRNELLLKTAAQGAGQTLASR